jgi:tripartite-type tricarboxylate transporter receptor subunit TctC
VVRHRAPKNVSAEIVDKLNNEINAGLADAKLKQQLVGLGGAPTPMSAGEFAAFIAAETGKWAKVIKFASITVE